MAFLIMCWAVLKHLTLDNIWTQEEETPLATSLQYIIFFTQYTGTSTDVD